MNHRQHCLPAIAAVVCSLVLLAEVPQVQSFVQPVVSSSPRSTSSAIYESAEAVTTEASKSEELLAQKRKLLSLLGPKTFKDPVLADPITKEGVTIKSSSSSASFLDIRSPTAKYRGSADTYLNLLEPVVDSSEKSEKDPSALLRSAVKQFVPAVPPPLRGPINSFLEGGEGEGSDDGAYIPMRDLFTNPSVSFAYERGWRQGFQAAGFPGPDTEAELALNYFAPAVARAGSSSVIVDMSCATGLFTRRLAKSGTFGRVLGCDYSDSMLTEARRRIKADPALSPSALKEKSDTSLDLVRLDVGAIPMQTSSVDCLHAGAAMHCWPDLDSAVSEIHRVLVPGGRYFATTFLSTYFSNVSAMDGRVGNVSPTQQAFQYFDSVDGLRDLLIKGGFDQSKIVIEVLGTACVVIRAEK
mmetsp:Transcript_35031/g.73533  ORF Transcript_35031/g.73533 Transcript_35031/m.73533 type:complete len:413 (-) Transcript_35031:1821-3059(-)